MLHLGFSSNSLLLCYLAMVMGNNRINNYKKCRKIKDDFDPHAAREIRRDTHHPMEHIRGFMQSH
jgi:hypothetical protein